MKTRIISFLSAAALLAGCYEDAGELGVDTATRIALSPAEIGFTADGTTVDGKVAYVGVVQVMPFEKGRYTWRAEGDVAWATVGETVVDESFADTWTGAVTTTRMRAVEIISIVRVICLVVVTEEIRFLMSRRLAMGLSSPLIQKHPNGAWP